MNSEAVTYVSVSCPLCGSMACSNHFEASDRLFRLPGRFWVVGCSECGCRYTSPRPAPSSLHVYYPAAYAPYLTKPVKTRSGWLSLASKVFHAYMYPIDVLDPVQTPGSKLLEIGCAAGAYLHSQKKYGIDVYGVEFGEQPARYAREVLGLNVVHGELADARYASELFDGAVAWMVLEHIDKPLEFLDELHRVLKPNAVFAFSVPNNASWESRFFKHDWYALDVPRHLTHFSPSTVSQFLSKAGFRVERIRYQRNLDTLIASLGLRIESTNGSSAVTEWLLHFSDNTHPFVRFGLRPILQVFAYLLSWLHQSSCITVVARRV